MVKLSRSKIDLFVNCPRCFWLEMNKGLKRPPPAPYTINNSIDWLLKQEFDLYRKSGIPHPVMKKFNVAAIPYNCKEIDDWRNSFVGVRVEHPLTNFLVFGAIDDLWVNPQGELIVVDYKATGAKEYKIYDSYRRQMEIYQWLFSRNGYKVSPIGYFLFSKVNKNNGFAEGKLSFDLALEPLKGDSSWVEETIVACRKTLDSAIPAPEKECLYCQFSQGAK